MRRRCYGGLPASYTDRSYKRLFADLLLTGHPLRRPNFSCLGQRVPTPLQQFRIRHLAPRCGCRSCRPPRLGGGIGPPVPKVVALLRIGRREGPRLGSCRASSRNSRSASANERCRCHLGGVGHDHRRGRRSGQPPGAGRPASCSSSSHVRSSQHPARRFCGDPAVDSARRLQS